MARRHEGGRRVSGRAVMLTGAVVVVFFLGAMVGGGWTTDRELSKQQHRIEQCLPLTDAAALDDCLTGVSR